MLRKSSYFVSIPVSVIVWITKNPLVIWIKGPLCLVVLPISQNIQVSITSDKKLQWSRLLGFSKRNTKALKRLNNSLVCALYNAFSWTIKCEERHFKLVGRGYKVLWSKNFRRIHLVLGFAQKRVLPIPPIVNVKLKNRYNFSLISTDPILLESLAIKLQSMRPPSVYTARGILRAGQVIEMRPGKQTQY